MLEYTDSKSKVLHMACFSNSAELRQETVVN